jgi:hypothetical protein
MTQMAQTWIDGVAWGGRLRPRPAMNHSETFSKDLSRYMETFLGYGNLNASLWFIGMEERGEGTVADLTNRVNTWTDRGCKTTDCLKGFHLQLDRMRRPDEKDKNYSRFFVRNERNQVEIQKTWMKLIWTFLTYKGEDLPNKGRERKRRIGEFQADDLGALDGDAALLELLPLPAQSIGSWNYKALAHRLTELKSRNEYANKWRPRRIKMLQRTIAEFKPRTVVFYGRRPKYRKAWEEVIGVPLLNWEDGSSPKMTRRGKTRFVIVPHPNGEWANDYWTSLGEQLRD